MQNVQQQLSRDEIERLSVELKPAETILMIVHSAMLVGATVLLCLFYWQSRNLAGNNAPFPLVFIILAILPVVPSFLIPAIMRNMDSKADEKDTGKLAGYYQVSHIIGCAILESGVMMSIIALRVADALPRWYVLVPAILILVFLLRFPIPGKLTDWVITKLESRRT
ncbi:MAG: hypothetical protein KGS49_11640 [Planctomycetes bacterium]|nr:hypothetical protein [Planctomycetota bacterium]